MRFEIHDYRTNALVNKIFRTLTKAQRVSIESMIGAVTDDKLVTAIRPFMFSGKILHELYFDPDKLVFFNNQEKIGAVLSALIISCLAKKGSLTMSDQELLAHPELIAREGRRWKHGEEVSAFVERLRGLEDEWRSGIPEDSNKEG
jgi:hypothetical protein